MFRRRRRFPVRSTMVAMVAMALVGVTTAPSGPALAAANGRASSAPTITASPASNLSDGQFVKLTLAGFPNGQQTALDFRQCIPNPVNVGTDCTSLNTALGFAVTDNTGNGSTYFPVYDGSDPNLKSSNGTSRLSCDTSHSCVIAAMYSANSLDKAILVSLAFGPSPDLCPTVVGSKTLGGGSAAAYRAMYQWESSVCQPPSSLPVGYTLGSDPSGVTSFMHGLTQFAVSGPWAPDYAPTASGSPPQAWAYAPLSLSGVVLAYRMYDRSGAQITNLTLTPDLIAQIFLGSHPNFDATPEIKALNPGIQFPTGVFPYVRADSASESWVLTSWLSAVAPTSWVVPPGFANQGKAIGASENFPVFRTFVSALTGNAAVGLGVVSPPPGNGFPNEGSIGFMDTSTAAYYGLPTVNIQRADGSVTSATTASILKAVSDATVNSDGTIIPSYATTDPSAWPMLLPTEMLVPTNNISTQTGAGLASFLKYAVGAGQGNLPAGYAPLPTSLVVAAVRAAALIPGGSPTPSPTPSASPSPTPPAALGFFGSGITSPPLRGTTVLPRTNASGAHATPAASTPSPGGGGTTRHATTAGLQLLLDTDSSHVLLPAAAGAALGILVAGAAIELLGRRRRGRARPT